jgi:hypothetical protein
MSVDNRLWGAPHIHGELLQLGIAVAQSPQYMAKRGYLSGQSWGTFLRNHMPHIAAMASSVRGVLAHLQTLAHDATCLVGRRISIPGSTWTMPPVLGVERNTSKSRTQSLPILSRRKLLH